MVLRLLTNAEEWLTLTSEIKRIGDTIQRLKEDGHLTTEAEKQLASMIHRLSALNTGGSGPHHV